MNNNALIEGRLGINMMQEAGGEESGYDLKNYGMGSKIARDLFSIGKPPSGGRKFGSKTSTEEILAKGKQAQEPKISEADAEDLAATVDELEPGTEVGPDLGQVEPDAPPQGDTADPELDAVDAMVAEEMPDIDPQAYTEEVNKRKQDILERRTWQRNVNLDYIEDAEDLGAYLDVNADMLPTADREPLSAIEADVKGNVGKIMKDVLVNPPSGNLNSRQLLAGRQMLLTVVKAVSGLSEKIQSGTATPTDLLNFDKYQSQAIMLQGFMQGQVRETARALNSMKIVAQALNTKDLEAISAMNKSQGMSAEMRAKMFREMKEENPNMKPGEQVAKIAEVSQYKESVAAIVNYWTASILSGPATQAVNVLSNTTMQAMNTTMVKPVAAGVGAARRALTNAENTTRWGEVGAEMVASREGLKFSILMGAKLFKQGTFDNKGEYVSQFGQQRMDELTRGSKLVTELSKIEKIPLIGGLVGWGEVGVRAASFGALSAGDEFFKGMAYRKSIYASAVRRAKQMGLDGDDFTDKANELIENPDKMMHDEAMSEAERLTFTNDPGGIMGVIANDVVKWAQIRPEMKFIVPFVRTPTALLDRTIRMSPLPAVQLLQKDYREKLAKGGAETDVAIAEMLVGTTIMATAYMLYQEGAITGEGPDNFSQREALKRIGVQQNSVRAGNTMVTYGRGLDPMGMSVGAIATMMDRMAYSKDEATAGAWFATGALSLAAYFKEAPYMTGFSNLMQLIDGNMKFDRWGAKQIASFIPSLSRDVAKIARGVEGDPTMAYSPRSSSFWDTLQNEVKARIPGQSGDLPPKRYWDGSIITAGGGVGLYMFNSVSPLRVTNLMEHPESVELAANGVPIPEPSPVISIGKTGMKVDLLNDLDNSNDLYDRLLKEVGEARLAAVSEVISDPQFVANMENGEDGPGTENALALQTAIVRGSKIGKGLFYESLMEDGGLDPGKYGEKAALLNEEALGELINALDTQTATNKQLKTAREAGAKGIPTRGRLYVPKIN